MEKMPYELMINILSFLRIDAICPFTKKMLDVFRCNLLWKDIVFQKFKINDSKNYYREFLWQRKLSRYHFKYQRQWTLGCVGRIVPPVKNTWPNALF